MRFAKDATNVNVQIEYLKKAIALIKEDTGVRKILAGIYFRNGRLEEAISQYKEILAINPDDTRGTERIDQMLYQKKRI